MRTRCLRKRRVRGIIGALERVLEQWTIKGPRNLQQDESLAVEEEEEGEDEGGTSNRGVLVLLRVNNAMVVVVAVAVDR